MALIFWLCHQGGAVEEAVQCLPEAGGLFLRGSWLLAEGLGSQLGS